MAYLNLEELYLYCDNIHWDSMLYIYRTGNALIYQGLYFNAPIQVRDKIVKGFVMKEDGSFIINVAW